jgi:regulator of replication initiation timing
MSYTSYPSAGNPQPEPRRDSRKLIYGILIAALVGTWGYIVYDKSKSKETITQLQTQYSNVDSARNVVQQEYNDALARMDSLTGSNTKLQGELADRKTEIDKLKANIKHELSKKNADLAKAKSMIAELNGKINDLLTQVEQLKAQNQQLTASNQQLTTERDTLASQKQVVETNLAATQKAKDSVADIGSTLHASNINITGINLKNGGKEKETTTAKRVDVFRISFDLDENRLSPSGSKELYVCVFGPDGKPITMPSNSGTFQSREEGEKVFTNKVDVQYESGKRTPVSFDWKPEAGKYQTGNYKVEIYQNGFKIGEGTKSLKKGGLFS